MSTGYLGSTGAIAIVQHLVTNLVGQIKLEARWAALEFAVQVNLVRGIEEGAYERMEWFVEIALVPECRVIEPPGLQPKVVRYGKHVIDAHREVFLTHTFCSALYVGKTILVLLLVCLN